MEIVVFFEGKELFDFVAFEEEEEECHGAGSPTITVGEGVDTHQLVVQDAGAQEWVDGFTLITSQPSEEVVEQVWDIEGSGGAEGDLLALCISDHYFD